MTTHRERQPHLVLGVGGYRYEIESEVGGELVVVEAEGKELG